MNYFFVTLLALCSVYACVAGGAPERIGAAAYAAAVAATHVILHSHHDRWVGVEVGVFAVDAILFFAFSVLALRANRFWPIWVSGLLGLSLLGHLARLAGPDVFWWAYAVILSMWSYPILALMAFGTWQHQRRVKRFGADPAWSSSSRHSRKRRGTKPNA